MPSSTALAFADFFDAPSDHRSRAEDIALRLLPPMTKEAVFALATMRPSRRKLLAHYTSLTALLARINAQQVVDLSAGARKAIRAAVVVQRRLGRELGGA